MIANRQVEGRRLRFAALHGQLRHGRRSFRPGAEALEGRALLALFPGNPIAIAPPAEFTGVGTAAAQTAQAAFRTAVGGANNGTTASPQTGGFRSINWDAVPLTAGGGRTVISAGQTVGIPLSTFQARGVFFDEVYAVSGVGFVGTNPLVTATTFPAFTPNNTFAAFNGNVIDVSFVMASSPTSTPVPAATRGFGAIFIGNQAPSSSTIEYFSGDRSLGKFTVPTGAAGQPEFLGELFAAPIVTRVQLTLGSSRLFDFDGTSVIDTGSLPGNLAITDDFDYAEPVPLSSLPPILPGPQGTANATATINATVGGAFSGVVATFSDDTIPTSTASAYTAVINWGDGQTSNGTIAQNTQGGFDVSGTNTFVRAGRIPVSVRVLKFAATGTESVDLTNTATVAAATTTITLTASPTASIAGQTVTFTATVAGPTGTTPTGNVTFLDGTTVIGVSPIGNDGKATFTTSSLARGSHSITAVYNGDASFNTSTSTAAKVTVRSDVTNQFRIILGRARRRGRRFLQRIELINNGEALPGPIRLVLDNLNRSSRLINASGTTEDQGPLGSPFIIVTPSGIAQNGTETINLLIIGRSPRAVRFTPRILAGSSRP